MEAISEEKEERLDWRAWWVTEDCGKRKESLFFYLFLFHPSHVHMHIHIHAYSHTHTCTHPHTQSKVFCFRLTVTQSGIAGMPVH